MYMYVPFAALCIEPFAFFAGVVRIIVVACAAFLCLCVYVVYVWGKWWGGVGCGEGAGGCIRGNVCVW